MHKSCYSRQCSNVNVYCFVFSFFQGDVFVVDDVIDSDWLWVTAQKNKEKGLVPAALVEDAVSIKLIFLNHTRVIYTVLVGRFWLKSEQFFFGDHFLNSCQL